MLAKLGTRFEDNLTVFEVECFRIISNKLNDLEQAELRKK
jgi:hypothetical protein